MFTRGSGTSFFFAAAAALSINLVQFCYAYAEVVSKQYAVSVAGIEFRFIPAERDWGISYNAAILGCHDLAFNQSF